MAEVEPVQGKLFPDDFRVPGERLEAVYAPLPAYERGAHESVESRIPAHVQVGGIALPVSLYCIHIQPLIARHFAKTGLRT